MEKVLQTRSKQFATFYLGSDLYGIEVTKVQEVTRSMPITAVPLSQPFIKGLINLRGQIATALGLSELFKLPETNTKRMSVVCRVDGELISLLVDSIGDVIEVESTQFEETPDTVVPHVKRYMDGVCKCESQLLSILNIEKILSDLLNNSK